MSASSHMLIDGARPFTEGCPSEFAALQTFTPNNETATVHPPSCPTVMDLFLDAIDDVLMLLDRCCRLNKFERLILISSAGEYITPVGFKVRCMGIFILAGLIWPWVAIVLLSKMIFTLLSQRRCCKFHGCDGLDALVRLFAFMTLAICAAVHQPTMIYNVVRSLVTHTFHHFSNQLSRAEIFEPSIFLALLGGAWVLELKLFRMEQSATHQLQRELLECDIGGPGADSEVDTLRNQLDLLGCMFSIRGGLDKPVYEPFANNLYSRLFVSGIGKEGSSVEADCPLCLKIAGRRLSSQTLSYLNNTYSVRACFVMAILASVGSLTPVLTRIALRHEPAFPTKQWTPSDRLLAMLFLPLNFIGLTFFLVYWKDGRNRFRCLTTALVLIIYLFGTEHCQFIIGGQFRNTLNEVVVNLDVYQKYFNNCGSNGGDGTSLMNSGTAKYVKLQSMIGNEQFCNALRGFLWNGTDKISFKSIRSFLNLRKYMYTSVATERVRVQQVFLACLIIVLATVAGIFEELCFRQGTTVPVTVVVCLVDLVSVVILLLALFRDAVNLNIVLVETTHLLLNSWKENIEKQRLQLTPEQAVMSLGHEITSLDFLVHYVDQRQRPIGFLGVAMTVTLQKAILASIFTGGASLVVAFTEKYADNLIPWRV